MVLLDVLYVPEFKFNLLFVSSFITSAHAMITFYHDSFLIQELHTKRMIGRGKMIEGLYVLDNYTLASAFSVKHVGSHIWHDRLGHSLKVLQIKRPYLELDFVVSPKDTY